MAKSWIPYYLPMEAKFENRCFISVFMKKQKLWVLVHMKLKWLLSYM